MTGESTIDGMAKDVQGAPIARHPCPYCAGSAAPLVASRDYNRQTTDETFFYFQCSQCGLVFMYPIPDNMSPYYEGGYSSIPSSIAELREIAAQEAYRLEPILRYKRAGSLLEIGPWRGVFCLSAKDAGFDVTAIEMDRNCVAFLNETLKVHAIQSYDPAAALLDLDEQFDAITMWHSMEHLPEPWKVVEHAVRQLKPDGLLLVSIPNIESYEFSVLRERWRHLDAPRHLYFYPISSLVSLCERNGLAMLEVTTEDRVSDLLTLDTWDKWAHWKAGTLGIRKIYPLTQVMMRVAEQFSRFRRRNWKNSGSGITAVFQLRASS